MLWCSVRSCRSFRLNILISKCMLFNKKIYQSNFFFHFFISTVCTRWRQRIIHRPLTSDHPRDFASTRDRVRWSSNAFPTLHTSPMGRGEPAIFRTTGTAHGLFSKIQQDRFGLGFESSSGRSTYLWTGPTFNSLQLSDNVIDQNIGWRCCQSLEDACVDVWVLLLLHSGLLEVQPLSGSPLHGLKKWRFLSRFIACSSKGVDAMTVMFVRVQHTHHRNW